MAQIATASEPYWLGIDVMGCVVDAITVSAAATSVPARTPGPSPPETLPMNDSSPSTPMITTRCATRPVGAAKPRAGRPVQRTRLTRRKVLLKRLRIAPRQVRGWRYTRDLGGRVPKLAIGGRV
jgi:hypothetical protein